MKIRIGDIEVLVEDVDHYLQINDINDTSLNRIWNHVKSCYEQYDKWFCYHNTEIPYARLDEIGAVLVDDSIEMRMIANNLKNYMIPDTVVQLNDGDFKEFALYHDKHNPEMYWSSQRIKRDLSLWSIFLLKSDNHIVGYILFSMWNPIQSEIYCIIASDKLQYEALITSAAKYAFDSNKSEVLYMADKNTIAQEAASAVGFVATGFYKGYRVKRGE